MKVYIVINTKHECWVLFLSGFTIYTLAVSYYDFSYCVKFVEQSKIKHSSKPDRNSLFLNNPSEKFFEPDYLWYDLSLFPNDFLPKQ